MKRLILLLTLICCSQFVNAYQLDVGVAHSSSTEDRDFDTLDDEEDEISANLLGASFYFSDVSTADGPLMEAAFLSKASGVTLVLAKGEFTQESDCCAQDIFDYDITGRVISIHGVINGFVLGLDLQKYEFDSNSGSLNQFDDLEDKTNTLTFGHYIGDNQQWYVLLIGGEDVAEDDRKGFGGGYKAVFPLEDGRYLSVDASLEAETIDNDEDEAHSTLTADLSYYLNRELSLDFTIMSEATAYDVPGPDPESTTVTYLFGASYFPAPQFYVSGQLGFSVSKYDNYGGDDADADGGELRLGLGGRF